MTRWTWLLMLAVGCSGKDAVESTDYADSDADSDADTDADADTDTDADSDTDADTDTTVISGDELLFDASHVLVLPNGDGLTLVDNTGAVTFDATWTELVGSCSSCGGEGASADGDGLLLSFTTGGGGGGGGNAGAVARVDGDGALDFRADGFDFPHDAVRDPADDTVIIPEANTGKMTWIDESGDVVRQMTTSNTPGWPGDLPNGVERFDYDGRSYLLSSHRGGGGSGASGEITLWDITTAGSPGLVWTYPSAGSLNVPHGCAFRFYDGQWWMLYAHTYGASDGTGAVGLAVTSDPTVLPDYVADLEPSNRTFTFFRGVELTSDGVMYLTDSGGGGGGPGGGGGASGVVVSAPMPSLSPTGATGAVGDQVFVDFTPDVLIDGINNPFEGWLWVPGAGF